MFVSYSHSSPVLSLAIGVKSKDQCDGSEWCRCFEGSLHRTFLCPNADDNFDGVEKSKYDLFNAYKLDVSSVVYDKLSAETAGNDGDSLIYGMTHWTAARLDGSNCPQWRQSYFFGCEHVQSKPDHSGPFVEIRLLETCPCTLKICLDCTRLTVTLMDVSEERMREGDISGALAL